MVPESNLIDLLKPRYKNNNFDLPLNTAFDICNLTHEKYSTIVLYFMSDGKSKFP